MGMSNPKTWRMYRGQRENGLEFITRVAYPEIHMRNTTKLGPAQMEPGSKRDADMYTDKQEVQLERNTNSNADVPDKVLHLGSVSQPALPRRELSELTNGLYTMMKSA